MTLSIFQIIILAFVQGITELLPVSSSAHVIMAEKFMGIDPTAPEMTFLLVMLHTGTMISAFAFFGKRWFSHWEHPEERKIFLRNVAIATLVTGVAGLLLKEIIEATIFANRPEADIEELFGNLGMIATALALVGLLILIAGRKTEGEKPLREKHALIIGLVQGMCLPFRGFSRSGSTISAGLLLGIPRMLAEEFSFALAVVLTPPVVLRELMRLIEAHAFRETPLKTLLLPGFLGMVFSFFAGLLALYWLSNWIERGRWTWFGYYCLFASVVVFITYIRS